MKIFTRWMLAGVAAAATLGACAVADTPDRRPAPGEPVKTPTPTPLPAPTATPVVELPKFEPSGNTRFDTWRAEFGQRAVNSGRNVDVVHSVLASVQPIPEVQAAAIGEDQPEFVKPIWDYVASATTPARIEHGIKRMAEESALFSRVEAEHAPPREILSSIWGMETSFGRILGNEDAVRQLATLAYTGQRVVFAEKELLAIFQLLEKDVLNRDQLKRASWAGAVGQTQFMPTTFVAFAEDGDGDNRIDLWDSTADALMSAANYLSESGWRKGEPWALEAVFPADFNYALGDGAKRSIAEWRALGVTPANNRPAADDLQAELFLPAGSYGPAFLLFDNFYVIRKYNNADSYALSIGLLADRLAQRPALTKPWPTNITVLSKTQVMELQEGLNKLGYKAGPIDGLPGRTTRAALQSFQVAQGVTADGFPTLAMLNRVKAAAS